MLSEPGFAPHRYQPTIFRLRRIVVLLWQVAYRSTQSAINDHTWWGVGNDAEVRVTTRPGIVRFALRGVEYVHSRVWNSRLHASVIPRKFVNLDR
jgi:hypothetical protein